jgi:DHA2 family integral membrane protein (MFS transporter)
MVITPDRTGELENSPRRWWVLGVLVLSLLVVQMDTTILGVAVQRLSQPAPAGLALSQGTLQWAINAYTLVMAGMLLTTGGLADRLGRKRVLLTGMVLFGLASAACAFSTGAAMLISGRSVLGLAAALVTPTTLAIITNTFSTRERPRAIGIWSGGIGVAVAGGPIVGGLLLDHLWWGSIFLVNVPIVAVAVIVMAIVVPESRNPGPGRFDIPGTVLSLLGMVLLVAGILEGGDTGRWDSPRVWAVGLVGLAVLAAFLLWERRAPAPLLPIAWFRSRTFSGSIAVMTVAFLAMLGATFTLAFYLLSLRGLSVLHTGLLMLPLAVAQLALSSRTPGLAARFGPRTTGSAGMLALAAALLLFTALDANSPWWIVEVSLTLIGIGVALVMPSASAAVMMSVPKERGGSASATSNAFRQIGGALGNAVIGAVLASTYRSEVTGSLSSLSADVRDIAAGSIQATQAVLDTIELGPADSARITEASNEAFVSGFHASALVATGVALAGAIVAVTALAPRRSPRGGADSAPPPAAQNAGTTDPSV